MVALLLLESAHAAGMGQQHGEGVLGNSRGVGTAHVGHDDVAVGNTGDAPQPFDASAGRLHPAQLFAVRKLVSAQLAVDRVGVAHQRCRRRALVGHDELHAMLLFEFGETLRITLEGGRDEHFHHRPFLPASLAADKLRFTTLKKPQVRPGAVAVSIPSLTSHNRRA